MAVLTATATERPHIADFQLRKFTLGAVANGDTFTVPGGASVRILGAFTLTTTGALVQWTVSGQTLTAVTTAPATAVAVGVLVG